jgi:tetratricopeptide (TPR) repeat protein
MPPTFPERPGSTANEFDIAARVPPPRSVADAADLPTGEGAADIRMSPIAAARVRDAEARNATAAELFRYGKAAESVSLFEQALASCRIVLGTDHPDTLRVAGNLAVARVAAGDRRKGTREIDAAIAARARVLGDGHPDTLTARNALAVAYRLAGQPDRALGLAKRVVLERSRALGPTHVDTLTSRMGLALALAAAGEVASAYQVVGSTLNDAEVALGPAHGHLLALIECGEAAGLLRREL